MPQGGILSPLLANIALSVVEERYERHVSQRRIASTRRDAASPERRARNARRGDKQRGNTVVFPIRYADDFLLLVGAPPGPGQQERARQDAEREKADEDAHHSSDGDLRFPWAPRGRAQQSRLQANGVRDLDPEGEEPPIA
jgi:hypothetical protein